MGNHHLNSGLRLSMLENVHAFQRGKFLLPYNISNLVVPVILEISCSIMKNYIYEILFLMEKREAKD